MKLKVMLTCVGAQVSPSVIQLIRNHPQYSISVIGVDALPRDENLSVKFLDKYYQVPMGDDENYISVVEDIVKKNDIKLIFIGSDEEALSLAKKKEYFRNNFACEVCCSPKKVIEIASDKYQLMNKIKENGIEVAEIYALKTIKELGLCAKKLGYPQKKFIIKPRLGRGTKGFRVVSNNYDKYKSFYLRDTTNISLEELEAVFRAKRKEVSNYLVMEYLPGDKYSADVLVNKGNVVSMVIRNNWEKPKINPPTQLADIEFDRDIREYATKVVKSLKFDFFVQVEMGRNYRGKPRLIETNTRLDAALPITTGLGINFYHELMIYAMTGKFRADLPDYERFSKKLRFIRYWQHYFKELEK